MNETIAEEFERIRKSGACATPVPLDPSSSQRDLGELLRDQRALALRLHHHLRERGHESSAARG